MRGLRPRAVAARLGLIAPGITEFAAGLPPGQDIDILPRAHRMLFRIGGRYLFEEDADSLLAAGGGLPAAREAITRGLPWPRWMPTPARRALTGHRTRFSHQLQQVIDRRRAENRLGEDVLGQMLKPSSQYGLLPDTAIHDSLTGLIIAGSEVPTRAVGWLMLALARHPDLAERIATEAAALPDDPHHPVNGRFLAELPFTEAFVREVLRLHPPNWLQARIARRRTELAGYPIAPGTMVLVCSYTVHLDPREHENPDTFSPDRWLDYGQASAESRVFLPFGTGPRACEGAALAMAELTLLAAETARRWHLYEPEGLMPSHGIDTDGGLTPTGLRLRVTPRTR
ncbi:cytochrome P450 [Streptomyces millisiae]|nr:cytochrome P450 [Streptomyces sp. DSM 44918]